MKKKLLSTILSAPLILSMLTSQVYATTNASNTQVTIEIIGDGPSISDKDGPLSDGNLISLTVPSVLPFIFNKNGTTTVPTDWTVKNYDSTNIKIDNIYFDPREDWSIHQVETIPGEYLLDKPHNHKEIEVLIGEAGKNNAVSIGTKEDRNNISSLNWIIKGVDSIEENNYNSTTLEFRVYRTLFTEASDEYSAFTMHIDFNFAEEENILDKNTLHDAVKEATNIYFGGVDELLTDLEADDLSINKDRSIVGKDLGDGNYHIMSDDIIYAPEDSSYLFADLDNLESIVFGEKFDTSKATTLENMFSNCTKLKSITLGKNFGQSYNIPTSGFLNTESSNDIEVINANDIMQEYNYAIDNHNATIRYNTVDKTKVNNLAKTCTAVYFEDNHGINIEDAIDLSETEDNSILGVIIDGELHVVSHAMIYAPEDCSYLLGSYSEHTKLQKISFNNFNTSNTTNMSYMFLYDTGLKNIDFGSNFDTSKVTDMGAMFADCYELQSLNLDHFNTSLVTDMSSMFVHCHDIVELDLWNFDTSKVTAMNNMFQNCEKLQKLNVSSFDTSKVRGMSYMFANCYELPEIDTSLFRGDSGVVINQMFSECNSLTEIYLSNLSNPSNYNSSRAFYKCPNLRTIIVNENFICGNQLFYVDELTPLTIVNPSESLKTYNYLADNRIVEFKYS